MQHGCLYNIFIRPVELIGRILWDIVQLIPYFILLFLVLLLMFNLGWIWLRPPWRLAPVWPL